MKFDSLSAFLFPIKFSLSSLATTGTKDTRKKKSREIHSCRLCDHEEEGLSHDIIVRTQLILPPKYESTSKEHHCLSQDHSSFWNTRLSPFIYRSSITFRVYLIYLTPAGRNSNNEYR
jgi:hypothetical protein